MVVGLLLLGAGAAWLARVSKASATLDDTLLAVAPFDVLEPSLALWHEGLMDVFSRTLDGVGTLRTVSPAVIARRWTGRADHASAAELARATSAARVLYGAVIPAGRDSVRLTASLLDARTREAVAEFDLHGPRDRIDRLADSLTLAVLRALAPPTGLAAPAGSPVGTASPTALKAFLEGEQHYRRSEFDAAQPAFRKAVTVDSGFALAWHRLSHAIEWRDSAESFAEHDPEIAGAAFRAAAARGLSVRDSLVLTADSLFWALFVVQEPALQSSGRFDERFWSYHTRLFRTLEEAHRRYPQDPEVVLSLAEAGWQWGGATGRPFRETLGLYDRAIALDSAFTPSCTHAAFIALAAGDPPGPCATSRHTFVGVHRHRSAACCGSWRHCSPRDRGRTSVRRGCSTPCRCTRSAKPSDCRDVGRFRGSGGSRASGNGRAQPGSPGKWEFPLGTSLGARGHLLRCSR